MNVIGHSNRLRVGGSPLESALIARRPLILGVAAPALSTCMSAAGPANERRVIPTDYLAFQDYLSATGARSGMPRSAARVRASVLTVARTDVCPSPGQGTSGEASPCPVPLYPVDGGVVRIDQVLSAGPAAPAGTAGPAATRVTDQPGAPVSGSSGTVPGSVGQAPPASTPSVRQPAPLQVGMAVETRFLLTARPARVRYVPLPTSQGSDSSPAPSRPATGPREPRAESIPPTTDSARVAPGQRRTPLPVPMENGQFVFTTRVGSFPQVVEKVLPGLAPGDRFEADVEYDGTLYVEEYERIG
ncbi:MAG TPA: hypothetical protein VFX49_01160 [Chloroflexota bacterium]|nr:hypothetical protein [Chloroflexota bacterium]